MFKRWCRLIGREYLFGDPRFADDHSRWTHGDMLNDLMPEWCDGKSKAEVLAEIGYSSAQTSDLRDRGIV